MRKLLISLILLTGVIMAQFDKGTVSAGTLLSYSSYNSGGDYDYTRNVMSIGTQSLEMLSVKPTVSYFVQPNISIDGIIGFTKLTYEDEDSDSESSQNLLGGGATYYTGNLYGGGGIAFLSFESDDYKSSSKYLEFHGGYLHGLTENVFLDIGVSYLSGMGELESEYDGEENPDPPDNEQTILQLSVGIKAFFNLK